MINRRPTIWFLLGALVCLVVIGAMFVLSSGAVQASSLAQATATPGPKSGISPKLGYGFGYRDGNEFISATASVTGLTQQEVVTQLRNGKSLAQIAQDKGKTADDVIKAARTQLQDQLKQAVTNGRITQAQADAKLAQFDQTAPQIVSNTSLGLGPERGFGTGFGFKGGFGYHDGGLLVNATVSVTGLSMQEVMTDLQNGQSLAQIAQSKGKTADDVMKTARTQLQDQLKQAVTNGGITQAQSDALLSNFDQNASQLVNDATLGSGRGFGPGFGRGFAPGFRRGFGHGFGRGFGGFGFKGSIPKTAPSAPAPSTSGTSG
jgi:ElaB/YqjD/DUF883 family membrane-anchored ribosome-binding protein